MNEYKGNIYDGGDSISPQFCFLAASGCVADVSICGADAGACIGNLGTCGANAGFCFGI